MRATAPVPRDLVLRLWYGVAAAVLFLTVASVHGATLQDFDSWHQSVSALAIAPHGWIQTVNFFVLGAIVLSTASAWQRILAGGIGATWYPRLTAVLGISFILAGFIPQDPAPGYDPAGLSLQQPTGTGLLHLAIAGVAATSSVASLFVMASRLKDDVHWRRWPAYSRTMALVVILCVIVYGVWSTRASGYAGTFERLSIILPTVWGVGLVGRLWRGTPLMLQSSRVLLGGESTSGDDDRVSTSEMA